MVMGKFSVTLDADLIEEAREHFGNEGLSQYLNEALAWRVQHERLSRWLAEMRTQHGPTPPEIRKEVDALWHRLGFSSTAEDSPPSPPATHSPSKSSKDASHTKRKSRSQPS